ncbi:heat shock factor protein isoform X2 [Toxorhynchites rutilus septentrionalis]|uniref:heat shock factor protein isoform X2 n=1 Tax=Toxorhynchites rutilus septentrionalis TaxID=329112 RepID=UPI002479ABDE|nr:heat shock factor protein isoform X2 [Toxorhynchites rutilus septentrionalis]
MHTFSETGAGVPAFLAKLWRLVEDPETNDLISWSTDGRSFIIQNQAQFAKELLPLNYKHNNMASFIRQLNMYGFHKITSIDNGGLRFDKDEMEFTHPCFQKDHPYLLEHIKRKIATSKQQQDDKSGLRVEAVNRVLSEMKQMRGRQETLDTRFNSMKQENEALWREIAILRQKHMKQQQIVNKLIQFLVTIVQPSRSGLGSMGNGKNKRRFQLMINDAPQSKVQKTDANQGATIQELGEVLEEVAYENEQEMLSQDKSKKEKCTNAIVRQERSQNSDNGTRSPDMPEVTSPSSLNQQSPYRPESVNEMIEEVLSPVHLEALVKQEKVDPSSNATRYIIEAGNGEEQDENNYDDEEYLVDHVDELDPCNVEFGNDTDMLNTPMVIREMQKQEQLKQQKQQQANRMSQLQKSVNRGESLLRAKNNGIPYKTQKSLLTNNNQTQPTMKYDGNVDAHLATRGGKKPSSPLKQTIVTDAGNNKAGPSGTNNFAATNSVPSLATIGYEVGDFTVSEVPSDIFEDNNQLEKESPMLGAFNFEGGFYNPNVNINEMKGRQQQSKQQSQQLLPNVIEPNENIDGIDRGCLEDDEESGNAGNALARFSNNELDLGKLSTITDYDQHINTVENELESLKDLLKGDGYQLDANTLLGLFSGTEDIMGYDFPMNLPDATVTQRKPTSDSAITAITADSNGSNNTSGLSSTTQTGGPSNQLITYKNTTGNGVTGDYIDLNELLNLENTNDDEASTLL